MKLKLLIVVFAVFLTALFVSSCNNEKDMIEKTKTVYLDLPETPYGYSTPSGNINSNVATLGRVLFYDTHLSVNNSVSCASCHKQVNNFADNVSSSRGFENHLTTRNSPAIQNLSANNFFVTGTHLFWDGRAHFLNTMIFTPMLNHVEMGMTDLPSLITKLESLSYYDELFVKAFASPEITSEGIGTAMGEFISSINSNHSKFDLYQQGIGELSALELSGKNLFFDTYNCNSCHQTQVVNGYELGGTFANIGLESHYTDPGVGNITNLMSDNGKFKIPDLRNIAFSAPYMHDGRFATLNDVLEHYSHGIIDNPGLDPRLRNADNSAKKFNINENQKAAIIAFLNTLSDYSVLTDSRFSSPFKQR